MITRVSRDMVGD